MHCADSSKILGEKSGASSSVSFEYAAKSRIFRQKAVKKKIWICTARAVANYIDKLTQQNKKRDKMRSEIQDISTVCRARSKPYRSRLDINNVKHAFSEVSTLNVFRPDEQIDLPTSPSPAYDAPFGHVKRQR